MIGGIIRGGLSPHLRHNSQKITSILTNRRLNSFFPLCGAYCTSAGDPRRSDISSKVAKKNWELIRDEIASSDDHDCVPDKPDILVSPLIQVFSISISSPFKSQRPSEIYGCIEVNEGKGSNFTLYSRGSDDYETISSQGNLSLIGPEYCALLCRTTTTLNMHLKDRRQGMEIISSRFVLHSNKDEIDASCDKLTKAVVQGEHGFAAHLYYTTFRYAAFACVKVGLVEKYDKSCDFADIHGSIVAGYAHPKPCYANNDDLEYMKTVLFNKPPDKTIRDTVPSASPIPLSRRVVAVPAYGRLKIEVDLRESGVQFAAGCVEFDAFPWGQFVKFVVGDLGVVSVEVSWKERVVTSKENFALRKSEGLVFPHYLRNLKQSGFSWLRV